MIPGNRPEDTAFETFCEGLERILDECGIVRNDEQFERMAELLFDLKD